MKKWITEGNLHKAVDMTVEERMEEYKKALNNCYALRKAEYIKQTDALLVQIQADKLLVRDVSAMEAEFISKQEAIKAKHPKPLRSGYELD